MPRDREGFEYRKACVRMWQGGDFMELSRAQPNGQTLFLYLLLGDMTVVLPGAIPSGPGAVAEALGWTLDETYRVYDELIDRKMLQLDKVARLTWLPNALIYNPPYNTNQVKAWANSFVRLPDCALKSVIYRYVVSYLVSYPKGYAESFRDTLSIKQQRELYDSSLQDSDLDVVEDMRSGPDPEELGKLWNSKVKKPIPKVRLPINRTSGWGSDLWASIQARLNENPSLDEWEVVIDNIVARGFCNGDNDSGWVATFAFLGRHKTFHDHFEGKFSQAATLLGTRKHSGPNLKDGEEGPANGPWYPEVEYEWPYQHHPDDDEYEDDPLYKEWVTTMEQSIQPGRRWERFKDWKKGRKA
jgi:hypothetical protein